MAKILILSLMFFFLWGCVEKTQIIQDNQFSFPQEKQPLKIEEIPQNPTEEIIELD